MEYRFSKDPLFGKYCYIDTPWIAGKNTIYRIINTFQKWLKDKEQTDCPWK